MIKIVLKSFLVREQRADFSRGDTSPQIPPLGEPFPFPPHPPTRTAADKYSRQDLKIPGWILRMYGRRI